MSNLWGFFFYSHTAKKNKLVTKIDGCINGKWVWTVKISSGGERRKIHMDLTPISSLLVFFNISPRRCAGFLILVSLMKEMQLFITTDQIEMVEEPWVTRLFAHSHKDTHTHSYRCIQWSLSVHYPPLLMQ